MMMEGNDLVVGSADECVGRGAVTAHYQPAIVAGD
jgi:hypothetical protein